LARYGALHHANQNAANDVLPETVAGELYDIGQRP
jgi:hypothetical protein